VPHRRGTQFSHDECAPHPGIPVVAAKEKTFEPIEINNIGVAVDGPFTMGWRLPTGSSILTLLLLRPLVQ